MDGFPQAVGARIRAAKDIRSRDEIDPFRRTLGRAGIERFGVLAQRANLDRGCELLPGATAASDLRWAGDACPACNIFQPTMHKLKQSLPANAVVNYLPAAFNTAEDWPMFQLAYVTAQVLGVDQQTHDAMFDAVWKGGDLSITDPSTRALKSRMPTIEDAAKFYNQKAGVPVDKFVAASKSFSADLKVRTYQDLIMAYKVDRTPTIIVNGKYRLQVESAGGTDQIIELIKYLVAKESR
jgi:thiol:disulfide interchange protein DsbA